MTDLEFLSHLSECVRIKNRLNRIRDFTGQDLLASFKKLELKQLLSTIMKIKLYPDLSNQNSRFIQFDDFFFKSFDFGFMPKIAKCNTW